MTRALRFLALLTTLFVVTVRCWSALPAFCAYVALPEPPAIELALPSDEPREPDALAALAFDDSDDESDPLLTPLPVRVRPLMDTEPSGRERGLSATERASTSHARDLERPPRA